MSEEARTILWAVIPVFGLVVVGLAIRKLNWLNEVADESLLRVTINLLTPCLILDSALGNPALLQWRNLVLAPTIGFAMVAFGMGVAFFCGRTARVGDERAVRTFAVTAGLQNYSYVPIPLAMLLFDTRTVGVLFVHNVGVDVSMWTLGVMLLTGAMSARDWRKIINAPLLAIALAIVMNEFRVDQSIPKAVLTAIHWLGGCAIPMALILIGAVVADHLHEFHSPSSWRVIATAVFVRVAFMPGCMLLVAKFLPATVELKRVLVLEASMTSAVFPIVMSRHYGGDPPTALRVVIGTSVVGLVTIPLWIHLGLGWIL
jgi:predicted permease